MARPALIACFLFAKLTCAHGQWILQDSHSTADLRGIHNVGGGIAWASGANGTVLRTEDGGYLWQRCAVPAGAEKLDFRGILAFDGNTAIVMSSGPGDQSRLYKTRDGCQTWKLLFKNPDKDGFWDALFFEDARHGWLLGDPTHGSFSLFESSDAGSHWTRRHNSGLKAQADSQGVFAASNSSLFVKNGFIVFGTGGKSGAFIVSETTAQICLDGCSASESNLDGRENTWARQALPFGQKSETSGIFSIGAKSNVVNAPLGAYTLIAVGGDYKRPGAGEAASASSADGGQTWLPAQTAPHGYRSAVAYDLNSKTWITVGPNGTDISSDDGRNWRPLKPGPKDAPEADQHWNALSLPFVVGPNGHIGKLDPKAVAAR